MEIVSAYYMVAVVFLPLAYVTRTEGHITVELFTRNLPASKRAGLEAVIGVVGFVYMATFTWQTAISALNSTAINEGWETADDIITVWPSRWLLPIGCALMTVYLLQRCVTDFCSARAAK